MINLILQKYIENNTGITLISILRDELLLLPYFIDYYKKLGVNNFIFIFLQLTDLFLMENLKPNLMKKHGSASKANEETKKESRRYLRLPRIARATIIMIVTVMIIIVIT